MDDALRRLMPANPVRNTPSPPHPLSWDGIGMSRLDAERRTATPWTDFSQSLTSANDDDFMQPIMVADESAGSARKYRPKFTPLPDILGPWREHALRSLKGPGSGKGLLETLSERLVPSMYFPLGKCQDRCAMGRPEHMEDFGKTHTVEGTPNRRRCWEAVEDLESGNVGACNGRCRAMHHNW